MLTNCLTCIELPLEHTHVLTLKHLTTLHSSTPLTQTPVFQDCWMAHGLDCNGKAAHSGHLWELIPFLFHANPYWWCNSYNLPCLAKPKPKLMHDELDAYLATNIKDIMDALEWWIKNHATFPSLSRMAIDYLSIPGKLSTHFTL